MIAFADGLLLGFKEFQSNSSFSVSCTNDGLLAGVVVLSSDGGLGLNGRLLFGMKFGRLSPVDKNMIYFDVKELQKISETC